MKPVERQKGETLDSMIHRFRRAEKKEGILDAYNRHLSFKSTGQKRRDKHNDFLRRIRKKSGK